MHFPIACSSCAAKSFRRHRKRLLPNKWTAQGCISSLMRRVDGSDWFADPNLNSVKANPRFGEQASEFGLAFQISTPEVEGEEE